MFVCVCGGVHDAYLVSSRACFLLEFGPVVGVCYLAASPAYRIMLPVLAHF